MIPEAFTPKLLTTLREGYGATRLRSDLVAALNVAIVALPLAMALGIASGASPRELIVRAEAIRDSRVVVPAVSPPA